MSPEPFNRILIIRTDRIGDVILTTPVIRTLRQTYPEAYIAILISPATRDLVQGNPHLDEILMDDRLGRHKGPAGFWRLIRGIREKKFDIVFNFHTKKRTNLLCFLAGIPQRVGYRNEKFGFLLNRPVFDERPFGKKHEAQYCLDLLKAVGIDIDKSKLEFDIPLQPQAEEWADRLFKSMNLDHVSPIIAINPGASCPTRIWPVHRFVELIQKLKKYSGKIILVGGPDTAGISRRINSLAGNPATDLSGKTSLAQLTSVLKRCDLMVSNDTGPVHIAAALGIPVVSIFTRNQPGINPERWRPLGAKSVFIVTSCKEPMDFSKSRVQDPKFLEIIQAQEVLEAIDSIFKL